MTDNLSFQDLLGQFSEEIFVGRTEQLQLFDHWLNARLPPFLILAISGQGGVGKTTLLAQFRRKVEAVRAIHAYVDEDQSIPETAMARIAENMRQQRQPCDAFEERYRKYRELKEQIEGDPKAPRGLLDFAVRSATRFGMRSLRRIPVAGDIADVLGAAEAEDRIVDETSALAEYVRQKFANRDERILLLETDRELAKHLLADLSRIAQAQRIYLFFDSYEQTSSALDTWLRAVLAGEYGHFSSRIGFVIAGRYPLEQTWTEYRRAVRQVELDPFTDDDARQFLQDAGITDVDVQNDLIKLSEGLPVLLALLVSTPGGSPTSVASSAVDRFLHGLSLSHREAALLSAIPRWFNLDLLRVMLGDEEARAAFEWLSRAHFVRETKQGWRYHDVVRTLLLAYLRHRSVTEYVGCHSRMANYYRDVVDAQYLGIQHLVGESGERAASNELFYHDVSTDPLRGISKLFEFLCDIALSIMTTSDSRNINTDLLWKERSEILAQVYVECGYAELHKRAMSLSELFSGSPPRLQEVQSLLRMTREDLISSRAKAMLLLLAGAAYDELGMLDAAVAAFSEAVSINTLDPVVNMAYGCLFFDHNEYALALDRFVALPDDPLVWPTKQYWLGRVSLEMGQYEKSIQQLTLAVSSHNQKSDFVHWRGIAYLREAKTADAIADFTKTIELQPENGYNYFWRGQAYLAAKESVAAIADFTRAIELQSEKGYNYRWRGRAYSEAEEYAAAIADFTHAIELQPESGDNYSWRGVTYCRMGESSDAIADFTSAIERQPENGYNYHSRGKAYLAAEEFATAITDFTSAIERQPENGYNYHWRGRAYLAAEEYVAAMADFTWAIERQPENGYNYYWRGRAYLASEEYAAAMEDFTKAIEFQPKDGDNYYGRGRAYLKAEEYTAAIADFTKAIELQPEDGVNYYWRGRAYLEAEEYATAIADFTRAIELQPESEYNYYSRGGAYYRLRDYAAAIEDLSMAIKFQPENGYYYESRGLTQLKLKVYTAAEADFTKGIELQPKRSYSYYARGVARSASGMATLAGPDMELAATLAVTEATVSPGSIDYSANAVIFLASVDNLVDARHYIERIKTIPATTSALAATLYDIEDILPIFPGNADGRQLVETLRDQIQGRLSAAHSVI